MKGFCISFQTFALLAIVFVSALFTTTSLRGEDAKEVVVPQKTLDAIPEFIKSRNMGTTGMVILVHGKTVFTYGDVTEVSYIASCRKSVLSMMYGAYVENGTIDLSQTVGELGIDDVGGLEPIEKTATVLDLISARSGVYHEASNAGGIPEGKAPRRGKTKPGTRFVYNNWDFNVAGTVFEMKTGKNIYDAFEESFAKPLELKDWNRSIHKRSGDAGKSVHLAYHFNFSTRDMATLGQLALQKGNWNDKQIVPEKWMEESTQAVTKFDDSRRGLGYGYMWWIEPFGKNAIGGKGSFSACGMYGQYITVIPELDMVVAHKSSGNQKHPTKSSDYWDLLQKICSETVR
ncbi:MAG: serine hydrolase [Thermoguttaceae bacterium]|nr:serine hydrolase [Thermoguttaceae bacterium]